MGLNQWGQTRLIFQSPPVSHSPNTLRRLAHKAQESNQPSPSSEGLPHTYSIVHNKYPKPHKTATTKQGTDPD